MKIIKTIISVLLFFIGTQVYAQQGGTNLGLPGLSVNFGQGVDLVDTLQLVILFTVLTLAPAI